MHLPVSSGSIDVTDRGPHTRACLRIAQLQTAIVPIAERARTRAGIGTTAKDSIATPARPTSAASSKREDRIATGLLVATQVGL